MPKLKIVDVSGKPICPHCESELDEIHRIAKGIIEQSMVFVCPHCRKILSVGYNLGW